MKATVTPGQTMTPATSRPWRIDTRPILAVLLIMMFAGLYQIISQFSRLSLWGLWLLTWWAVLKAPKPARLERLCAPAAPFVLWFAAYGLWSTVASPIPVYYDVVRDGFRLLTTMAAIAVVAADRGSLRRLARLAPWALVLNLLVSLALRDSPAFRDALAQASAVHAEAQFGMNRFSGLWGNANAGGMNTLILLILSAWGRGWWVWAGRAAGLWLAYLTASRTTIYTLLLVGLLLVPSYLQRSRRARWLAGLAAVVVLISLSVAAARLELRDLIPPESTFARVLDITEVQTSARGGATRLDVLRDWLPVVARAPLTGHGYGAMAGGGSQGRVWRTDVPYMGCHNMYVGTWVEAGAFGGLSYFLLLALGVGRAIRTRLNPSDRVIVVSFWAVALVFSAFAQSLQGAMDGQALYLLCFILPPALARCRAPQAKAASACVSSAPSSARAGRLR